jgi:hypothetical protein
MTPLAPLSFRRTKAMSEDKLQTREQMLAALSPSPQGVTDALARLVDFCKHYAARTGDIAPLADASVLEQFAATPAPAQGEWVMDIPVEKYRTDEQRADIQRAWDFIADRDDALNSTEGHMVVLSALRRGRELASAPNAPDPVGDRADALEEAAREADYFALPGQPDADVALKVASAIRNRKGLVL